MLINGKVLHLRDFITKIYYAIEELRDLALIRGGKGQCGPLMTKQHNLAFSVMACARDC